MQTMKAIPIYFSLILMLLSPTDSFSQINLSRTVEIEEEIEKIPYDSTQNFLGDKPYGYKGQQLFLLGNDGKEPYRGFILDYTKSDREYDNTYKPHGSSAYNLSSGSSYEKLNGKYFDVIDVIPHPQQSESSLYRNNYFLKLKEVESGDEIYFNYSGSFSSSFPFIVVGYYEKLESEITGKEFVIGTHFYTEQERPLSTIRVMKRDRKTDEKLTFVAGETWQVIGLTIDEDNDFTLSYLLENERGNVMALSEFVMNNAPQILALNLAEKFKDEFGNDLLNKALSRDVEIGWHNSLVIIAVGYPRNINETTTGNTVYDQYVYGDGRYLYFENDILRSYQGEWMFGVPYNCFECLE